MEVGQLLLAISTLTFLGLGAPPPTPEWGAMFNEGRTYFLSDPHVMLIPGLTISSPSSGSTSSATASATRSTLASNVRWPASAGAGRGGAPPRPVVRAAGSPHIQRL